MEPSERQLLLDQLTSSEARLLGVMNGLTPEQWTFRQTPERWSIAGNIEHVIAVENPIFGHTSFRMSRSEISTVTSGLRS